MIEIPPGLFTRQGRWKGEAVAYEDLRLFESDKFVLL